MFCRTCRACILKKPWSNSKIKAHSNLAMTFLGLVFKCFSALLVLEFLRAVTVAVSYKSFSYIRENVYIIDICRTKLFPLIVCCYPHLASILHSHEVNFFILVRGWVFSGLSWPLACYGKDTLVGRPSTSAPYWNINQRNGIQNIFHFHSFLLINERSFLPSKDWGNGRPDSCLPCTDLGYFSSVVYQFLLPLTNNAKVQQMSCEFFHSGLQENWNSKFKDSSSFGSARSFNTDDLKS